MTRLLRCAALVLGGVLAASTAMAYGLNITATGDDFTFVSSNGGAYYGGANWDNWHYADVFGFSLAPGEERNLVFHVHDHWGLNGDENPGAFLAQLDIAPGSGLMWETGGATLLTNTNDWLYALSDPLAGPATWYTPHSGWASSRPMTSGVQTNAASIWKHTNGGPIAGIADDAQWIWSLENFTVEAPTDVWFKLNRSVAPVPETGSGWLVGFGLAGLVVVGGARRK
ncbi:MAG: hypothetical protein HZB25_05050 [Candidatus Eisenbacteria bacterium]|nr:hypothetical protein [Candidatus Eisenbacteria bacterium]